MTHRDPDPGAGPAGALDGVAPGPGAAPTVATTAAPGPDGAADGGLRDGGLREAEARARSREAEARLRALADHLPTAVVYQLETDRAMAERRFTFVGGSALAVLGIEPARAMADPSAWLAGLAPADAERVLAAERGAAAAMGVLDLAVDFRRPDGRVVPGRVVSSPRPGADGRLLWDGLFLDMAAVRAAEADRDRARALLEAFVEAVPGVVFAKDRDGRMLVANRGAAEVLGLPSAAFMGRAEADYLDDPAQARAIRAADERVMATGVPEQVEEPIRRPDGSESVWFSTKAPWRDAEGRVVGLVGSAVDVTALKEAQGKLDRAEARFRFALDAAGGIGTWDWDIAADRVHASEQFARLYGVDPARAEAGLPVDEYVAGIHPDDREGVGRLIAEAVATGGEYRAEYRLTGADGGTRWVVARGRCLRGADGQPSHFPGVTFDITDRKAAEERLREAEERLRLATEAAEVGFWDVDVVNDVLTWPPIVKAMFGISPDAPVTMRDFYEGLHPEDREATAAAYAAAADPARRALYDVEYRTIGKEDGVVRWVAAKGRGIFDGSGRCLRVIGAAIDVTARREAEQRLRDGEARLRAVVAAAPVGLVFADAAGRITGGNARVEEIVGHPVLPSPDVESYREWVGFHPDGRRVEGREYPLARALAGEERPEMEVLYRRGDGREAWIRFVAAPMRGPDGALVGGVVASLDIDRERRAEAELRALNETLELRIAEAIARREEAEHALRQSQKMEAVGQLTGGIAHDFNNMLAAVMGSLDLLGRRIGEDARARRYVDAAMDGARRAATLTQRLLAFSRQQPLRPEPLDVNKLVAGMSDLLRHALGADVRLETVLAGGLWRANADPNQLEAVILNLAVNARDAMPEGGRLTIETLNAHLDSHYAAEHLGVPAGQYVCVAVTDTGEGMSGEVMARAFDPFFTTKPVGKGTGLGLSQVYGFVKQSGGHVKIYSEPGQGTAVKIYLPRLLAPPAEEPAPPAPRDLPTGEPTEVVLVVEDEAAVRAFSVEALRELGYRVLEADGAAAALRLLDAHPEVSLLFTDVVMPDVNGGRLAVEARRRRPGLKVLFTTGYTRNAVVHNGVLDPGVALIGKPFTLEELAAKVRAVLDAPG